MRQKRTQTCHTLAFYCTVSGVTRSDIGDGLSVRSTVNSNDCPVFTALYTSADDVTALPLIAVMTSPGRTPQLQQCQIHTAWYQGRPS